MGAVLDIMNHSTDDVLVHIRIDDKKVYLTRENLNEIWEQMEQFKVITLYTNVPVLRSRPFADKNSEKIILHIYDTIVED